MNLDKGQLEVKINELAIDLGTIKLKEFLTGGVVSDVYAATLTNHEHEDKNIVVKYTKESIPMNKNFSKLDIDNTFSLAQDVHNLDVEIQNTIDVTTPHIIQHYTDESITLMDNFTNDGYELLQNRLLNKDMPEASAKQLGKTLATLRDSLEKQGSKFTQLETSQSQFDERFLELKVLLYNGRIEQFNQIEQDFLSNSQRCIMWTDGDQKNFAIDSEGKVMAFDLGRSIICDPDFMLPNFLGHLGLFIVSDYLKNGINFLKTCQESFQEEYTKLNTSYQLDETKFVNYFTASLLHRGMAMRRIDPKIADNIGEDSLKYACMHFGDLVLDKTQRITSIQKMYATLQAITKLAIAGDYKRKEVII